MQHRRYFVLLAAVIMAASTIILAGPAGAITNTCTETINPAGNGNASGLRVACTFASAVVAGTNLTISDAYDPGGTPVGYPASGALYHYGQARNVNVVVTRTGAAPGTTAGQVSIRSCPTNLTLVAVSSAACPAPGAAPGNLAIGLADINHSVEFPLSTATFTGVFINPGSFIKAVSGATVSLSKATLAGGPLCPGSPPPATCANSVSTTVLVSNGTNRQVTDGNTALASPTVTSATAHFCGGSSTCTAPSDVGARVSGGDLPDGATILTVNAINSITLTCTACVGGFTGVTKAPDSTCLPNPCPAIVLTLDPANPPTSARYVNDGTSGANKTLSSATAKFASTDVGMPVVFNPAIANMNGARIATITSGGGSATLIAPSNMVAGAKKFTIGKPTKTAPATGDVMGQLGIELTVNPALSPTSPPCAAHKVSGFQINLQWKNPGAYNLVVGGTNYQGAIVSPTSIAQLIFNTSATSFGGFLKQNVTISTVTPTTTDYQIKFEFLPVGVGLCPGTGIAETFDVDGISLKQAQNPTYTGGGGGNIRMLSPIPQGTSHTYTGATGVEVVTANASNVTQFSGPNNNTCTVNSPNLIQIGC
jgi:hypothetical protein